MLRAGGSVWCARVFSSALVSLPQEFALEDAHVWFVRFSMDFHCRLLACGTRHGRILVWDPNTVGMHPLCTLKRGSSPKMTVRFAPLRKLSSRNLLVHLH